MAQRDFQVLPWRGRWAIRRRGAARCTLTLLDRAYAWREARRRARGLGVKAFLHDDKGRVTAMADYRP